MRRIGLGFEGGFTLRRIPQFAHVAEDCGFDSVWFDEGLGGDAFSLATACIPTTKSIMLGTSVTSAFTRSPTIIAMAAATVNTLSNGRFRLGLGSSHRVQVEGEHGLAYVQPLSRVLETVEVVRKSQSESRVSHSGGIFSINGFEFLFEQQRTPFPIYLAGVFQNMLRKAGEVGDGVVLTSCNPEQIKRSIAWVKEGANSSGRDAGKIDIANFTPCCVSEDSEEAKREMRRYVAATVGYFPRYARLAAEAGYEHEVKSIRGYWLMGELRRACESIPDQLLDSMTISGRIEDCRRKVDEIVRAGINLPILLFHPISDARDAELEALLKIVA